MGEAEIRNKECGEHLSDGETLKASGSHFKL